MDTRQLLAYLINFPLMMLIPLCAFFLPLQKKKRWYAYLPLTVCLIGLCVGLGLLVQPVWSARFTAGFYFALHYLLVFGCYTVSLHLMCGIPMQEALYAVVCAYMTEHFSSCLAGLADHFFGPGGWWAGKTAEYTLLVLSSLAVWYAFAKPMCREGHYPASAARSAGLLLMEMEIMYGLSQYLFRLDLKWLHSLYAIPFVVILLAGERQRQRQLQLQQEFQQKESLWALHKTRYEMTRDTIDIINRKCHDMRHQMMAMQTVADAGQRETAMENIRRAVRIYDTAYRTGCESLDTVLMQKALDCSQDHIALSVIADGALLSFMDPVDLYTMMANILDNAIEANRLIPDEARRTIHVSVHEKKGLVLIQAENPYSGTVTMKDGLPVTIKKDAVNHGIGTRSIQATAEKYDGVMRIDTAGGMFVLRIIFHSREPVAADQGKKMHS